jgi:GNAT superfamily N-acetyltransferase
MTEIAVTYLEITDPAEARGAPPPRRPVELAAVRDPTINRDLYAVVGRDWSWTDRLTWSDGRWAAWAERVETWVASVDGQIAGYYELDQGADGSTEIAIFGLLPEYQGFGLGGHLLTRAIERGFALGHRVWAHTCTLDAPAALANYRARGMTTIKICHTGT